MLVATSRWILAYVTQSLAGFFHTGDLAMRDDQGRYHVLGRVASTHAVAGGNVVVPDQVENVYQASPFVRQNQPSESVSFDLPKGGDEVARGCKR